MLCEECQKRCHVGELIKPNECPMCGKLFGTNLSDAKTMGFATLCFECAVKSNLCQVCGKPL